MRRNREEAAAGKALHAKAVRDEEERVAARRARDQVASPPVPNLLSLSLTLSRPLSLIVRASRLRGPSCKRSLVQGFPALL